MNRTIFCLALAFSLAGCNLERPCPDDILVGEGRLLAGSRNAFPYTGTETLVFREASGDSLILTCPGGLTDVINEIVLATPCSNLPKPQFIYYRSQQIATIWRDQANQLRLWHTARVEQAVGGIDTVLVDRFSQGQFNTGNINFTTGPNFVLSERGNESSISDGYRNTPENRSVAIDDTTFNGKRFTNLFRNVKLDFTIPDVYWSPDLGTVAFKDRFNNFWVLYEIRR